MAALFFVLVMADGSVSAFEAGIFFPFFFKSRFFGFSKYCDFGSVFQFEMIYSVEYTVNN